MVGLDGGDGTGIAIELNLGRSRLEGGLSARAFHSKSSGCATRRVKSGGVVVCEDSTLRKASTNSQVPQQVCTIQISYRVDNARII